MSSQHTHWADFHRRWARLGPPLRPNAEVVAAYRRVTAGSSGPGLLLGVTPELADFAENVTAIDRSPEMIANLWPGNTSRRRAMTMDWGAIDFEPASFAVCIGDGSLNALPFPAGVGQVLAQLARVLRSHGRFACRVYLTPDACESVAEACGAAVAGRIRSFHAFKWRLAMALVAEQGRAEIAVADIRARFCREFADRAALARASGFGREDIDTIDVYEHSQERYCFPSQAQLLSVVPAEFAAVAFEPSGTYELAERCPLLVATRL